MNARDAIFAKLNKAPKQVMVEPDVAAYYKDNTPKLDQLALLKHWSSTMRAVKTEIYWVRQNNWQETLLQVIADKKINNLLFSSKTEHGKTASEAISQRLPETILTDFTEEIDSWKEDLFHKIDAGFTDVRLGIAQTGTLLLTPDKDQPRSMSLVPPIHIALFDTSKLMPHFFAATDALKLKEQDRMPSNIVLISGPSKTADIQLTLAYGAHGPRDLVVLAILPDEINVDDLEDCQ